MSWRDRRFTVSVSHHRETQASLVSVIVTTAVASVAAAVAAGVGVLWLIEQ